MREYIEVMITDTPHGRGYLSTSGDFYPEEVIEKALTEYVKRNIVIPEYSKESIVNRVFDVQELEPGAVPDYPLDFDGD